MALAGTGIELLHWRPQFNLRPLFELEKIDRKVGAKQAWSACFCLGFHPLDTSSVGKKFENVEASGCYFVLQYCPSVNRSCFSAGLPTSVRHMETKPSTLRLLAGC